MDFFITFALYAESAFFSGCWRYIVDPALMPWMTLPQPPYRQPSPLDRPVRVDGLPRISRAGRPEAALRAEEGRQQQAVGVDQQDQQAFHQPQYISVALDA